MITIFIPTWVIYGMIGLLTIPPFLWVLSLVLDLFGYAALHRYSNFIYKLEMAKACAEFIRDLRTKRLPPFDKPRRYRWKNISWGRGNS